MDSLMTGDERALAQRSRLNDWIKAETNHTPGSIMAGYTLEGKALESYNVYSLPLMVSAMIRPEDQQWLNGLWDHNMDFKTQEDFYYSNTLRLLCALAVTGNWGEPR